MNKTQTYAVDKSNNKSTNYILIKVCEKSNKMVLSINVSFIFCTFTIMLVNKRANKIGVLRISYSLNYIIKVKILKKRSLKTILRWLFHSLLIFESKENPKRIQRESKENPKRIQRESKESLIKRFFYIFSFITITLMEWPHTSELIKLVFYWFYIIFIQNNLNL